MPESLALKGDLPRSHERLVTRHGKADLSVSPRRDRITRGKRRKVKCQRKSALPRGPLSLSLSVSVSVSVSLRCFQLQDGRLYVIGRVISGRSRSKLLSGHALPDMYKENCKRFRKEAKRLLLNSLHPKPGRAVRSRSPLLPRFFNFSYFSSRASSMCLPFSGPLSLSLPLSFDTRHCVCPGCDVEPETETKWKSLRVYSSRNLSHSTIAAGKSGSQLLATFCRALARKAQ